MTSLTDSVGKIQHQRIKPHTITSATHEMSESETCNYFPSFQPLEYMYLSHKSFKLHNAPIFPQSVKIFGMNYI